MRKHYVNITILIFSVLAIVSMLFINRASEPIGDIAISVEQDTLQLHDKLDYQFSVMFGKKNGPTELFRVRNGQVKRYGVEGSLMPNEFLAHIPIWERPHYFWAQAYAQNDKWHVVSGLSDGRELVLWVVDKETQTSRIINLEQGFVRIETMRINDKQLMLTTVSYQNHQAALWQYDLDTNTSEKRVLADDVDSATLMNDTIVMTKMANDKDVVIYRMATQKSETVHLSNDVSNFVQFAIDEQALYYLQEAHLTKQLVRYDFKTQKEEVLPDTYAVNYTGLMQNYLFTYQDKQIMGYDIKTHEKIYQAQLHLPDNVEMTYTQFSK